METINSFLLKIFYEIKQKSEKITAIFKPKIFCISVQRTGTTSVGEFFRHFGYRVAGWPISYNSLWSYHWYNGDYKSIFNSKKFKSNQVFEDSPWWYPEFYKILFHNFPKAKFILFIRNSDDWFNSMLSHSKGKSLGNTRIHSKIYRREKDFFNLLDNKPEIDPKETEIDNLLNLHGMEKHYRMIYEIRNREIIEFFNKFAPTSLFVCHLEDPFKWQKLGDFIGIKVPEDFNIHKNRSSEQIIKI